MARLFVAVWPPSLVLDELGDLDRPAESGVRWTTREQWHVTLRFLGDADPGEVHDTLAEVSASPATAWLGPRAEQLAPRVVVVPVGGIDELARAVCEATGHLGRAPDPRPFAGHITLARLGEHASCGLTGTSISGSFPVPEITLVDSVTHLDGARYTVLARFPLEQP